uniref:ribosomal protein S4 n=1 Tax=Xyris capensis TaxID=114207 RepID=UPI001F1298F9|nr:ribosomal protein S4 [Xyris capensis]ULQ68512.1 ribosomal protein S4 [Xyris capensis]
MSRYLGPRCKKIRRLGILPGLTNKQPKFKSKMKKQFRSSKKLEYRVRLEEKQKLRFHYGLREQQLYRYVNIAGKGHGNKAQILLQLLEMRLDNILFRLGMASTIPAARQLVNHRHILVNEHTVNIPSYRCKVRDIITIKDNERSKSLIKKSIDPKKLPKHLEIDSISLPLKGFIKQTIDRKWVGLKINEFFVVEYFARYT